MLTVPDNFKFFNVNFSHAKNLTEKKIICSDNRCYLITVIDMTRNADVKFVALLLILYFICN